MVLGAVFLVLLCLAISYILYVGKEASVWWHKRRHRKHHSHHSKGEGIDIVMSENPVSSHRHKKKSKHAVDVNVPDGYGPGDTITVEVDNKRHNVTIPAGVHAGDTFSYDPTDVASDDKSSHKHHSSSEIRVTVPEGYGPGDKLKVEVEGERLTVAVPEGFSAGQTFSFDSNNTDQAKREKREKRGSKEDFGVDL